MSVSLALRFRVLARDRFTCQYCGATAPQIPLEIDHITPRSAGGEDVMSNLVTACYPCNSGKSDMILTEELAEMIRRRNAPITELPSVCCNCGGPLTEWQIKRHHPLCDECYRQWTAMITCPNCMTREKVHPSAAYCPQCATAYT